MTSDTVSPAKEITYGAISGMVGKIIEFPFDTIKVRLQSSQQFSNLSTLETINFTYLNEGFINGFYRGLKAPLFGACLETSILFTTYNLSIKYFVNNLAIPTNNVKYNQENLPFWSKCVSGGFAGFMAAFVLTPIELIKCKLQVSNLASDSNNLKNTYSSITKQIILKDGVFGLWNGLSSTLIREVGGTAIWFGTYEFVNDLFKQNNLVNDFTLLTSGALAGITFNLSMFPIDTIKSNIQTYDILHIKHDNQTTKSGLWKITRQLISKKGGIKNLYNGLNITLIRAIPANALVFYTYETLKRNF